MLVSKDSTIETADAEGTAEELLGTLRGMLEIFGDLIVSFVFGFFKPCSCFPFQNFIHLH